MSNEDSISMGLTIINSILWTLFGHFSQPFDWLALYLWIVNDFMITNPVVRSLVLMPGLRMLGDAIWEGIDTYDNIRNTTSPFMQSALPSPLWYIGELIGDTYLPLKAAAIAGDDRTSYFIIWAGYSLVVVGKVGQIIGRSYLWFRSQYDSSQVPLTYFTNSMDIYIMFAGMVNDYICSVILYTNAKKLFNIKRKEFLKTIQTNSSFRIVIYTIFKTAVGIYWSLNICDAYYTTCPFYFLRDIIITLDYQMYYLDYFLIQHYGKKVDAPVTSSSPKLKKNMDTVQPLANHTKKNLTFEKLMKLEKKLAANNHNNLYSDENDRKYST
ncbi:hypothetical protein HDV01_004778 [Terramyces sp. JEL0728]|nr:hypothetical protein HDV01_004778 [Terramyces sp. JEL0728]